MENTFIPQAIEIVGKAIEADNAGEYEKALGLYRDSLGRFTMGLKYEKNEARKKLVLERVEGYMRRAEELRDYITKQNELDKNSSGGSATAKKGDKEEDNDAEKAKLRGALAGAIVQENPDISWDDVIGLENAKDSLKETVILPTRFPQLFTGKRKPFKGILLFGPPGTGKSYLAKAVATEADSTFFSVSSADLISKWQGESEKLVRNLFELARESEGGRAIIFIDEVDSLCGSRSEGESDSMRRVKTEFLVQMDGVGSTDGQLLVLGATNIPWELDAAIRRRFEKRVYIPLPEAEARSAMVKLNLGDTPNNLTEEEYDKTGEITVGSSGADIKILVKEALMQPLRRCQKAKQFYIDEEGWYKPCEKYPACSTCPPKLSSDPPGKDYTCDDCGAIRMSLWDVPSEKLQAPKVLYSDFKTVMKSSVSSVSPEELDRFTEWTKLFGQDGA
jgi:vacuolar protein-sorting-associated protein 4